MKAIAISWHGRLARSLFGVVALIPTWSVAAPLPDGQAARGWTILSKSEPDDMAVIAAAKAYDINHLQLSHEVVMNLRDVKDEKRRGLVNRLTDAAHHAGIGEVVLWDHALYGLDYYPKEFRTGPGETIDLDNPKFWEWFKADYRAMLDLVPKADGIVLTFIETGARAERQQSAKLTTNQEKLAAVVDAVADVVCTERKLNLYARTFAYTYAEYENIIGAIDHIKNPAVRLMMKETPHDFFLTHPNDFYAGRIARPTLMEFDAAGEFNGQGVVAITWPEYILKRWRDFAKRPHIIGYTARSDRYGNTRLIGTANEINLWALKRAVEDRQVTADQVYDEFISSRYGQAAVPELKASFKNAFDIVSSTIYTLGTNVASHSAMAYDPYRSSYVLHVSGKWMDPPIGYVRHGVDREFHYWRDVIDHVAPPFVKAPENKRQWAEVKGVVQEDWIHPGEQMDEQYLKYILAEKDTAVALANDSLNHVVNAKDAMKPGTYEPVRQLFERTLLTARLHRAAAAVYYGSRVMSRGAAHQTEFVKATVKEGLEQVGGVTKLIRDFKPDVPKGQWDWRKDAQVAEGYARQVATNGMMWKPTTRATTRSEEDAAAN